MRLDPGTVVDRYTIVGRLGGGGMAVVYLARHNQIGSVHAVKVLSLLSPTVMERLLVEGRVQGQLRHPNIVAVTDVVDIDGAPGLVLEYVAGPTLAELIADGLSLTEADQLARGLLRGAAAAHRHGLVHRDLKPSNVLVAVQEDALVPKISDFGLVKVAQTDSDGGVTRSGVAIGTPAYMAPEQIRSARDVDARADVWSLGAVLHELVTGHRAFRGTDPIDVFETIKETPYVPPDGIPERMRTALKGALAVDPAERFADAAELLDVWTQGAESLGAWDPQLVSRAEKLGGGERSRHFLTPAESQLTSDVTMGRSVTEPSHTTLAPGTSTALAGVGRVRIVGLWGLPLLVPVALQLAPDRYEGLAGSALLGGLTAVVAAWMVHESRAERRASEAILCAWVAIGAAVGLWVWQSSALLTVSAVITAGAVAAAVCAHKPDGVGAIGKPVAMGVAAWMPFAAALADRARADAELLGVLTGDTFTAYGAVRGLEDGLVHVGVAAVVGIVLASIPAVSGLRSVGSWLGQIAGIVVVVGLLAGSLGVRETQRTARFSAERERIEVDASLAVFGVELEEVEGGTLVASSGQELREGDVITGVFTSPAPTRDALLDLILDCRCGAEAQTCPTGCFGPGRRANLVVQRDGAPTTLNHVVMGGRLTNPGAGRSLACTGETDAVMASDEGLPSGADPRTIEAWWRTGEQFGERYFLSYGQWHWTEGVYLGVGDRGAPIITQIGDSVWGMNNVSDSEWHHFAATFDGRTWKLFIDGDLANSKVMATETKLGTLVACNTAPGPLGRIGSVPGVGTLDEVRIWNVARSQDEIRASMRTRLTGEEAGLLVYWDFDDTIGRGEGLKIRNKAATGDRYDGVTQGGPARPYSEKGSPF